MSCQYDRIRNLVCNYKQDKWEPGLKRVKMHAWPHRSAGQGGVGGGGGGVTELSADGSINTVETKQ